jgi:hypothetical protein
MGRIARMGRIEHAMHAVIERGDDDSQGRWQPRIGANRVIRAMWVIA